MNIGWPELLLGVAWSVAPFFLIPAVGDTIIAALRWLGAW